MTSPVSTVSSSRLSLLTLSPDQLTRRAGNGVDTTSKVSPALDGPEAYYKAKPKTPEVTTEAATDNAAAEAKAAADARRQAAVAEMERAAASAETEEDWAAAMAGIAALLKGETDEPSRIPKGQIQQGSESLRLLQESNSEVLTKLSLADQSAEGASLIALQTRQQIGTQSLALAGQQPQSILDLLR